ncbi:MAG: RluA family pseudouridine synthase [FCB group bacterium]|nr:RluA family pseudouridine synthase [FCB group bacterium]
MLPEAGVLTLQVAEKQRKERIDVYIVSRLPAISRSRIKTLIAEELITVDSVPIKPSHKVSPGETIEIKLKPRPQESYEPENIPLKIIYEDDNLAVIDKPAGLVVHPAQGNWSGTLVNALLWHNRELSKMIDGFRAGIVHRLDKDTTGLMVIAKDEFTHMELARQFSARTIDKKYQALVWGHFKKKTGMFDGNLGRHPKDRKLIAIIPEGKPSVTHYQVIDEFELFSLVEIKLQTGRTHQIRVHFSHNGHPVFGDSVYGGRNARFGGLTPSQRIIAAEYLTIMPRQALHAKSLGFFHPVRKEDMVFDSDLPEDLAHLLEMLR